MRRLMFSLIFAAAFACCLPRVDAKAIAIHVTLDGNQAVPPIATPGTGQALVIIDDTADTVFVDLSYSGLTTPTNNAHIHCCSGPSGNSGVVIPFDGFVTGATSGTYTHLFTGIDPGLIAQLEAGLGYINIHTTAFPAGEIRGNIVTPEPTSVGLLGIGLALAGYLRRKHRS
jgi:hypothetical protein